jgi:hypothetical protein
MLISPGTKPYPGRQTNLLPSPGTKPYPGRQTNLLPSPGNKHLPRSSNKFAVLSRNQTHTQSRQTNMLPSRGIKPYPGRQTCCPLQEPNPYPSSSNKPAAICRNQTPSQDHIFSLHRPKYSYKDKELVQLLFCPVSCYFLLLTYCIFLSTLFSLSFSLCRSINVKDLVSHSYRTETQNVGACQAH